MFGNERQFWPIPRWLLKLLLDWVPFCSQIYHQRKSLYSRRQLRAWADVADDGEEGTQLHSLPMFMQLAGERVRKGRLHWALPSTEINSKIHIIFNRRGNCLQFCIKELFARCASHLSWVCSRLLDISRDFLKVLEA